MPLSREFWEKKADKLYGEWDSCEDICALSITDRERMFAKVGEACTISMMLITMDDEVEKAKKERII